MKKSIIAGASVLALAGAVMPMAGVFAAGTTGDSATDTISVAIEPSCTFTSGGSTTSETGTYAYTGTNEDGAVDPQIEGGDNVHSFAVFCNDEEGYTVTAKAYDLTDTDVPSARFEYKGTLPSSGTDSAWNAAVTRGTGLGGSDLADSGEADFSTATIITKGTASGATGETFSVEYTAWIGTATPAGTYTGTIAYTLAANN